MTIIDEKKLTKVADNLYSEPYKDGDDFKWYRELQLLSMDVYSLELMGHSVVSDPRYPFDDEYSEEHNQYLTGIGVFDDREIHLIGEDGSIGPGLEQLEFSIRSYRPDDDNNVDDGKDQPPRGNTWYQDEEAIKWERRSNTYLQMELLVTQQVLAGIIEDLDRKSYERVAMTV